MSVSIQKRFSFSEVHCAGSVRRGHTGGNPESSECDRHDHTEQFYILLRAQAVAAMGITQKINMVPLQVAMGFSQGIMPLISYNYASGNHRRMKETIFFTIKTLLPFLVVVSLGYFAGAGVLTRAFYGQ